MGSFIQQMPGRGALFTENMVRLGIRAFKMASQDLDGRKVNRLEDDPIDEYFEFIIQQDLQENLNHTWGPLQNMAGRLGQLADKYNQMVAEGKAEFQASSQMDASQGKLVPSKVKVDSPIMYSESSRRKLQIQVLLVDQNNPELNVQVAEKFKRMSCAKIGETAFNKIDFPYIFEVATVPHDFFVIKSAALDSVMVTYKDWVGGTGYPGTVEMNLNFVDLEPLYEKSFDARATVTTG